MGLGARGMGMGNALTAITSGELSSYYNPALPSFAGQRSATATYAFLSLDRWLAFLNYTQSIRPTAGLSAGVIYAGVHDIDGRDSDGEPNAVWSSSEYQFFFAFSNKFSDQLSIGIAAKLYVSSVGLQEERRFRLLSIYTNHGGSTATTVGIDAGLIYRVTDFLTVGAVVQDIDAKYRWDTANLYGRSGTATTNPFPLLRRIGISYRLPGELGIVAVDVENNNQGTTLIRAGAEVIATEYLTLRGGVDRIQTTENENGVKPSLGFTLRRELDGTSPSFSYAYVFEPFSTSGMSIVSISFGF